jgi:MFS family permease
MRIPSEASSMFILLIDCLLIGFILNWLLAERIGNRNRFVTWILSLLVFVLVFCTVALNFGMDLNSLSIPVEMIQLSIIIGLTVGILFVSFPLAGFLCRKRFGAVKFSLWMAFWVLATTMGFFLGVGIIEAASMSSSYINILLQVLIVGLVYGGILIVGLLPFEIVLFTSSFWRKRFEAIFGLKCVPKEAFNQQQSLHLGEDPKPTGQ